MEGNGEAGLPSAALEERDGDQPANLSDVFEAISNADPSFQPQPPAVVPAPPGDDMFPSKQQAQPAPAAASDYQRPYIRIVEQPASKALRFRYECEGRSAGSIPGVHSTPENKTYPTIEIVGHKGHGGVVVVSCVTKDKPHKPHPHNLVGREQCSKGVCTAKLYPNNMMVSFSNLGIQCVKKKDIEEALRTRESLRVDPFKTGFSHKSQAQGIDLNAVRLCFQVYMEHAGNLRHALTPVVSDIIYDKKAMNDLVIKDISHRSAPVVGGEKIIILCEKVVKEDIAVTFFESVNGEITWQKDAVDLYVHKQYAITFTTPCYKNKDIDTDHVKVFVQLKRPSDNVRSEAHQFYLTPVQSKGTKRKRIADLSFLSRLIAESTKGGGLIDGNNNDELSSKTEKLVLDSIHCSGDSSSVNVSEGKSSANIADDLCNGDADDLHESVTSDKETLTAEEANDKSLNELLDQVAELDEIYSENRMRLENVTTLNNPEVDIDDFNDAGTYTSLQLAFKNPVTIAEPEPEPFSYEDVQTYQGPIIEFRSLKDGDDDRAPPLPPKRIRKAPSVEAIKANHASVESLLKPGRQLPLTRNKDLLNDHGEISQAHSEPTLPPAPKKRSFLSRLFRRKEKSPKLGDRKERRGKPVARSVSSISAQRPSKFKSSVSHTSLKDNASTTGLSYADSITHISLHGDADERSASQTSLRRPASLAPIPPTDGDTILVAESVLALDALSFKKLQDDLDLTDAEHYALYMTVAPHATVSEFDETSCYYSPVDGNSNYLKRKRQKPLFDFKEYAPHEPEMNNHMSDYHEIMAMACDHKIKLEPRDRTPPHVPATSLGSMPVYHNLGKMSPQQIEVSHSPSQLPYSWNQQMVVPGPSMIVSPYSPQDMNLGHQAMNHVSPNMGHASPNMGHMSPNMGHISPGMGHISPGIGHVSPNMGHVSPNMNQIISNFNQMSPNMDHMHMQYNMVQQANISKQLGDANLMDTASDENPSITGLFEGGPMANLNSAELPSLSFLDVKPDQLSDSLDRLSTSDLLPRT